MSASPGGGTSSLWDGQRVLDANRGVDHETGVHKGVGYEREGIFHPIALGKLAASPRVVVGPAEGEHPRRRGVFRSQEQASLGRAFDYATAVASPVG